MINKQNLWFITLFSLILVLSIYYVTMSDDALSKLVTDAKESKEVSAEVTDSNVLAALRVADDEDVLAQMEELQTILLDGEATLEEKNDAYDSLEALNANKGKENTIEKKIKKEFNVDSFVKIKNNNINITIKGENKDYKTANAIIRSVQSLYDSQMYITVKYQN